MTGSRCVNQPRKYKMEDQNEGCDKKYFYICTHLHLMNIFGSMQVVILMYPVLLETEVHYFNVNQKHLFLF